VEQIEFKAGKLNKDKTRALALAYVEARTIMNRLDRVLGIDGWRDRSTAAGKRRRVPADGVRFGMRPPIEYVFGDALEHFPGAGHRLIELRQNRFGVGHGILLEKVSVLAYPLRVSRMSESPISVPERPRRRSWDRA
jgi:hypothetical protein